MYICMYMFWITLNTAINYLSSYYSMLGWLRPRFSLSLFFFLSCDKLAFAVHSWGKRVWIWQNKKMQRREAESERKSRRDTLQAIVSYWNASMFALRYHSNSTPLGGRRVNEWAGRHVDRKERRGEEREGSTEQVGWRHERCNIGEEVEESKHEGTVLPWLKGGNGARRGGVKKGR